MKERRKEKNEVIFLYNTFFLFLFCNPKKKTHIQSTYPEILAKEKTNGEYCFKKNKIKDERKATTAKPTLFLFPAPNGLIF